MSEVQFFIGYRRDDTAGYARAVLRRHSRVQLPPLFTAFENDPP